MAKSKKVTQAIIQAIEQTGCRGDGSEEELSYNEGMLLIRYIRELEKDLEELQEKHDELKWRMDGLDK